MVKHRHEKRYTIAKIPKTREPFDIYIAHKS